MSNKKNDKTTNNAEDEGSDYVDTWILLDQTRHVIFRARELELNQSGITPEQGKIIRILKNNPEGIAPARLPKLIIREKHSVYALLARMEKRELVKKVKNPENGEITILLTKKGEQMYNSSLDKTCLDMILSVLSRQDIKNLTVCLKKLKARTSNLLGIDYTPPFLK